MCNVNEGNYAGISENKPNTKTAAIHAATEMSSQVLSKTTLAPISNGSTSLTEGKSEK